MSQCPACGGVSFKYSKYDDHIRRSIFASIVYRSRIIFLDPQRLGNSIYRRLKSRALPITEKMRITNESGGLWGGVVAICTHCGHGSLKRMPTDDQVKRFYTRQYWDGRAQISSAEDETDYLNDQRASHQLHFVRPFFANSTDVQMLEIGAGPAYASQRFQSSLDVTRIFVCEAGEQWDAYYRARNITRIARYFPFSTEKKFDYIHISHWIEHVLDATKTVSQLRDMTVVGGRVFVEIPNTAHDYWATDQTDNPHLQFFTVDSVSLIFEAAGFRLLTIDEFGPTMAEAKAGADVFAVGHSSSPGGQWIRSLFEAI